jgi:hypothetical protein
VSIFDKLLGLEDPTRDWPIVGGPAPPVQPSLMQLDAPRLGDSVESARVLGRPDAFTWKNRRGKEFDLLYASKGLRLRFKGERLAEVELLIGPKACDHAAYVPAHPKAPDGTALTPETTRARIAELVGQPEAKGSDEEVMQIFHGRTASDFWFDPDGTLRSWSLYPND